VSPTSREPLEVRRAERELFFWTARESLKLIVLTALTAYFLVSIIEGRIAGYAELLRLFTGMGLR
jgi:hypothetical protein